MTSTSLFSLVTQRENLATEALLFILNRSRAAQGAFVSAVNAAGADLPDGLSFRTQAAEADGAVPDLVGEDAEGRDPCSPQIQRNSEGGILIPPGEMTERDSTAPEALATDSLQPAFSNDS